MTVGGGTVQGSIVLASGSASVSVTGTVGAATTLALTNTGTTFTLASGAITGTGTVQFGAVQVAAAFALDTTAGSRPTLGEFECAL